jgi:hypothetical protein
MWYGRWQGIKLIFGFVIKVRQISILQLPGWPTLSPLLVKYLSTTIDFFEHIESSDTICT